MPQGTQRLRRRLAAELGECCDEDVQQRLDELERELGADVDDGRDDEPADDR